MSEAKETVELFQKADQMIVDYLGMMQNMQRHIRARIERGTPLPQGAVVALHHGVENDIPWLRRAISDLKDDTRVVTSHLSSIRRKLGSAGALIDMISAGNLLVSWPNNTERSMETVINTAYKESSILAPPLLLEADKR